jgi:broad specificity phosphatase PhoE
MADTLNSHYQIAFLRHGESTGNAEERFQGQSDFPLSPLGRAQARALASRWQADGFNFDCIVTSPLSRAAETAQIIGSALGAPVETEPLWMERHNGQFSGMRHVEIRERFPSIDNWGLYQNFAETGEGDWELYLRAGQALHSLMRKTPGRYLVV